MKPIKLSNTTVLMAYSEMIEPRSITGYPHELLMAWTGERFMACYKAIKEAQDDGLVTKTKSTRDAEMTAKGKKLLAKTLRDYRK